MSKIKFNKIWVLIAVVCTLSFSVISVLKRDNIVNIFSSVFGAFETQQIETVRKPVSEYDENLNFSFKKAPIQYAVPRAKINNALSFEIENSVEDFEFNGIIFTIDNYGCASIKRANLTSGDKKYDGYCSDGKLKFRNLGQTVYAGTKVAFVLGVSLSSETKIGQHVNFYINNPRDIEASAVGDDIYLPASYPMKVSTIYVVGLNNVFGGIE